MREMHCYKRSQREKIPSPDFQDKVTEKLLLEFLCGLYEWTHVAPYICRGVERENHVLYVLYRDSMFTEYSFWQTFGGYLVVLHQKWIIDVFGSELCTQEAVAFSLEQQNNELYAVQKTVSGQYAESVHSLCLRIQCSCMDEAERLYLLFQVMDWKTGILVAEWNLHSLFEEKQMADHIENSCFCYGNILGVPTRENYLDALNFSQKVDLWSVFLQNGFDYVEFEWLYDRISARTLDNRIEWEVALHTVLEELNYTLKISESAFELYDGEGERRYFNFNSGQNSQRAFLKMLFPIHT